MPTPGARVADRFCARSRLRAVAPTARPVEGSSRRHATPRRRLLRSSYNRRGASNGQIATARAGTFGRAPCHAWNHGFATVTANRRRAVNGHRHPGWLKRHRAQSVGGRGLLLFVELTSNDRGAIIRVMHGRDTLSQDEIGTIRAHLRRLRVSDRDQQKKIRAALRRIGFRISDFATDTVGFTVSDFVSLVARGIHCDSGHASPPSPSPRIDCLAGAVPDNPGLYAIYSDPSVWGILGLSEPPDDRPPLYIGKAENGLVARDLKTRFATGATGRSSPRRSFAALLSTRLGLTAIPRRPTPSPGGGATSRWSRQTIRSRPVGCAST